MSVVHDVPLVSTIAVGLSLAFVSGMVANKLKLSPLVGYLLAGVLIGPFTPGFIADAKIAEQLSEIGIVLLMFGVGLHFSIQDFMEVRRIALTGALVRIGIITTGCTGLALLWGWSLASGILLGLSLSVASTVVLLRVLEEHHLTQTVNGKITIGWLIVEDIAMVLAMVLFPALAVSDAAEEGRGTLQALALAIGKVGLFIGIMFVVGRRFLPWLLTAVSKTHSRELFTLAVFSMAMGIAFAAAALFGVSFALGAFFAGMMIRESDLNHEVADRALPFQDAFAVLFFVSVGMLFDPTILTAEPLKVLIVVGIILLAKSLIAFCTVMAFGYPLRTGLMVSTGLAQIGEFSFILIALGSNLEILPAEGRDLILAGALISIALNPMIFRSGRRLFQYVERSPRLARMFNMEDDALAHLGKEEAVALKDLVILVGSGSVGKHVAANVDQTKIDLVIIDSNREKVEHLRSNGYHAIAGDATLSDTLIEAAIQKAIAILITVPDPFEANNIAEDARRLKPSLKVVVRAHNDEEMSWFEHQHVDLAVSATDEIASRMVAYLNGLKQGAGTKAH